MARRPPFSGRIIPPGGRRIQYVHDSSWLRLEEFHDGRQWWMFAYLEGRTPVGLTRAHLIAGWRDNDAAPFGVSGWALHGALMGKSTRWARRAGTATGTHIILLMVS